MKYHQQTQISSCILLNFFFFLVIRFKLNWYIYIVYRQAFALQGNRTHPAAYVNDQSPTTLNLS